MPGEVNPALATDLSKVKGDQEAVDLSKEAVAQRKRERKLLRASHRARTMNRVFKGHGMTRRRHVENALRFEGLID